MDAVLCLASSSLSLYLPISCVSHYQTKVEQFSKTIAFGLSLGLFSLSLTEAVPTSWLVFLSYGNNDVDDGGEARWLPSPSVAAVYLVLLWCLAVYLLIVLPALAGISLAESLSSSIKKLFQIDKDSHKYLFFTWTRSCPWWIRFIAGFTKILVRNLWRVCEKVFSGCRKSTRTETILVLTSSSSKDNLSITTAGDEAIVGSRSPSFGLSIVGSIFGICSCLVMVRSLGPLLVETSLDKSYLSIVVSWLCSVGLLISSLLNGFGSVSMPHSCLTGLYLKPVQPEVIKKLKDERVRVNESLEAKRINLREMTYAISSQQPGFPRKFSDIGEELSHKKALLKTEIDFLEDLSREMGDDVEELRQSQMMAAAARTTVGKVKSYIGVVFSIILLVRLFSAGRIILRSYTTNVDQHKVAQGDIVTTILLWMTGHNLVSPERYAMFSQIVSMALSVLLSFSQVRTFLRTVDAINRRLNHFYENFLCSGKSKGKTSAQARQGFSLYGGFTGYMAAFIGCSYSLSCIVLIKMMLPEEFCEGFSTALGGLDVFSIHTSFVNTAFVGSSAVSAATLGMLFGIQRQNNFRHATSRSMNFVDGLDAC